MDGGALIGVMEDMRFADPLHLWLLLLAPLAVCLAFLAWRRRMRAMEIWASRVLWDRLAPTRRLWRLVLSTLLTAVVVGAIALALARPRWGEQAQIFERRGVDVVFILDTSLSMAARDVASSRLWVAQTLIRRLLRDLPEHRVALVQAEGDGVVMVPLTHDGAAVEILLDAVGPGWLPFPGTELAAALDRAWPLFPERSFADAEETGRVIVLLSDGEDHAAAAGRAAALGAVLERLREERVEVHALGIGTVEGAALEILPAAEPSSSNSAPADYKRTADGEVVISRLVEETLERIAEETGGSYSRADSAAADLDRLVERIDALATRREGREEEISTAAERFQWPLALALFALVLQLAIAPFAPEEDA